jgi:xylulokinase
VPEQILTIGGSTRNHLLMQLKAAVYGTPLAVFDLPDATCLGAALLGGLAAGLFPDFGAARAGLAVPVRHVPPDTAWSSDDRLERQAIYAAAHAALRPLHARLIDH